MPDFAAKIDVREIKIPQDKLSTIYSTFDSLAPGEKMEILNDHAPEHLHIKLSTDRGGQFDWRYLEEGPDVWRISIQKI